MGKKTVRTTSGRFGLLVRRPLDGTRARAGLLTASRWAGSAAAVRGRAAPFFLTSPVPRLTNVRRGGGGPNVGEDSREDGRCQLKRRLSVDQGAEALDQEVARPLDVRSLL